MKKIIILCFGLLFVFADETNQITNLIKQINKKQFEYKEITTIYDPFVSVKKINGKLHLPKATSKQIKKVYRLEVIFQNKAKINGKWYKNNDKIGKYKIIIQKNQVYLKSKNKQFLLASKTTNIIKVGK
jgi:hypothetical protein